MHSNLDTFITNLIDKRGYQESSAAIREKIHQQLKQQLDEFIMTRIVAEFSEEELQTFEKMLEEKKSPQELWQFASDHIPNFSNFLTGTLLTFEDTYLS